MAYLFLQFFQLKINVLGEKNPLVLKIKDLFLLKFSLQSTMLWKLERRRKQKRERKRELRNRKGKEKGVGEEEDSRKKRKARETKNEKRKLHCVLKSDFSLRQQRK